MKTKLTLFVAVLAAALFGMGCASTESGGDPLKDGLVAYYPFNGNAKDESGNENDGEVKGGGFGEDRHGNKDGAYHVSGGNNETISLPDGTLGGEEQISVFTWVYVERAWGLPRIIGGRHAADASLNVWIALSRGQEVSDEGWLFLEVHTTKGENPIINPSKTVVKNGVWCFIGLTYNGAQMIEYNNAVAGVTLSASGDVSPMVNIRIGNEHDGGFKGSIDDIRIYNRALSAEEVKALYDLEKPKTK
jgi:hypothetical protein